MKEILNNTENRRLKMIELMNLFSNYAPKNLMLKKLGCKEATLRADVDILNKTYPDIFNVHINNQSIFLNYLKNANISSFYNKFINSFSMFNMLEFLFFNNIDSLELLADKLYTSISSVYRMINKFNSMAIRKYKIYIDTKNLNLGGSEKDIRSFFIQFFSEKYNFCDWPFDKIKYKDIAELIKYVYKIAKIDITYSDMNVITMVIAVNISRFKQGYRLYCNEDDYSLFKEDSNKNSNFFKDFIQHKDHQDKISKIMSKLNLSYNFITNEDIFGVFLQEGLATSFNEMLIKSKEIESFKLSLVSILKLTYSLTQKYNINLSNLDDLALHLHNSLLLFNTVPNSNFILFDRNRLYIEKLESRFPDFVADATDYISEYILSHDKNPCKEKLNFLLCIFFTNWEDLIPQLYKRHDKLKVLVLSRYNIYYSRSLKSQLELFFNSFMDISLCEEESIDMDYLNKCDVDLIITDTDLPKNLKKDWIRIHGNYSLKDYKFITDTIYMLMRKKKQYNIDQDIA